jgi:F-box and leucine-rich repeat protein 9
MKQKNLKVLDLSFTVRLTDLALMHICECLKELRVLKVRRCRALTDISVKLAADLPQLEVLDISECEALTSSSLINGIAARRNEKMKEIYLSALNISEAAIIKVTENFPYLLVLDLSFSIHIVDDVCVQAILKNLTLLRELNLNLCERISDAGLTGMSMQAKFEEFEAKERQRENEKAEPIVSGSIFNANPLRQQNPVKICLKSKAEREIVEDADRKRAMLQLAKEINLQDQKSSNFSIARLRGLRSLKLSGCNKVSDVSLIFNFKFLELREIDLSKLQQISIQGIKELVENCPALEVVNLSECHNINDRCIELITRKLPRLTTLNIARCYQLTDFSLDYIAVNCKRIRTLKLGGNRHMSDEPHLKLVSLETLRDISSIHGGSELENSSKIPRAPAFPSRI